MADIATVFADMAKPEDRPALEPGIGLCLSGGGFRATLYCLGSLWRLNDFGALKKLKMVTSVSGGSIVSAYLALNWPRLTFDEKTGRATNFKDIVAAPIRDFCHHNIAIPAAVVGLVNPFKSIGDKMAQAYEKLFGDATLQALPDPAVAPFFILYATSLQTGSSVRMSRQYLADYKVGMIDNPTVPLARAVAASSAFPPLLSPQTLELDPASWRTTTGATLTDPKWRKTLILADGGVYDNMGLEAVWHRMETVLISDAGAPLSFVTDPHEDWLRQTIRVLDVITDQTRALRKRWLIEDFKAKRRVGAYWGIRSSIKDYPDPPKDLMAHDSDITRALPLIRTQLDPFSDEEQGHLINWGYAMCDLAIRKWLPGEIGSDKGAFPVPEFALP